METKCTPGPWKLCYDGRIDGADGTLVIKFDWDSYKEFTDRPEREKSDARLIAAAREMLSALIAFRDGGPQGGTDFEGWHESYLPAIEMARAAIAKATGGQQ